MHLQNSCILLIGICKSDVFKAKALLFALLLYLDPIYISQIHLGHFWRGTRETVGGGRSNQKKRMQYYLSTYIHIDLRNDIRSFLCERYNAAEILKSIAGLFFGFFKRFTAFFPSFSFFFLINWQWPMQMLLAFWLGHRYRCRYTQPQIQLHCQRSKTAPAAYGIQFKNVSKRYITHYCHGLPSLDLEIPFTAFFPTPEPDKRAEIHTYIYIYLCIYVEVDFGGFGGAI